MKTRTIATRRESLLGAATLTAASAPGLQAMFSPSGAHAQPSAVAPDSKDLARRMIERPKQEFFDKKWVLPDVEMMT